MIKFVSAILLVLMVSGRAFAQADVEVALENFGVGGAYRPGDFAAIRLTLTSNLSEPHAVQVVWEVPEGTGDIAEITRAPVALSPGQPISVWLYAKILPNVTAPSLWTVRIYADDDGNRGEELGGAIIGPSTAKFAGMAPIPPEEGAIAVIGSAGQRSAGLDDYNVRADRQRGVPTTGHEYTNIVKGLAPEDLPDRWEGLDLFEAIVWTNATPGELGDAQARAIREWIERGGHFIIVLPAAGNDWGLGSMAVTPLHDLLPQAQPRTDEVKVGELLPVLSKRREIDEVDDIAISIRVFEVLDNYYEPLIALPKPDARVVGLQRTHGFGRITVLGVDVNNGQLLAGPRNGRGGEFVEADVIWNRILGRRVDTLQNYQLSDLEDSQRLNYDYRRATALGKGQIILDAINLQGRALAGISLAFLLFVAYWLVAGPVGFTVLKTMKRVKHAWLAFAATSALFTLIAWGGVKLFSQKNVQVQHITFLDFIQYPPDDPRAGAPPMHRITSWFSVFLPGYGDRPLELVNQGGGRNLLASFSPPGVEETPFRNVSRYAVSMTDPSNYIVPARSTTKQMYARWMGTMEDDSEWRGVFQVIEPITMTRREDGRFDVIGQIGHSLPGTLRNVRLILIEDRVPVHTYPDDIGIDPFIGVGDTGEMLNIGSSYSVPELPPDTIVDLDTVLLGTSSDLTRDIQTNYAQVAGSDDDTGMMAVEQPLTASLKQRYLYILGLFQQMPPPEYNKFENNPGTSQSALQRHLGRELDLSAWLTRPCIILIGELENSPLPLPLRVGDDAPESNGRTIVRWIYPLPVTVEDVAEEEPEE